MAAPRGRPLLLIWIALVAQAALLLPRLDLLPVWDDERYTLATAAQSPAGIIRAVEVDVHPPLYYLLMHGWLRLPWPGEAVIRARAFSALAALGATWLFWRWWLREQPARRQAWFLALWVLSPAVVLYARIGRSYSLQVLLAVAAVFLASRWLQDPANLRYAGAYVLAAVALLYTHYVPGLALVTATLAVGVRRQPVRQLAALAAIGVLYAPWMGRLFHAAALVAESGPHRTGPNILVDHVLKLGYAFVAFHFGETLPAAALVLAVVLTPAILLAWKRSWSCAVSALPLLIAVAGYAIAASWVSFAFVGARLLFLLPFYYLFLIRGLEAFPLGRAAFAGLLLCAVLGLSSYYRREDFLNKGYLVDFEALTRLVLERSAGSRAAVLLDRPLAGAGFSLHSPYTPYVRILADHEGLRRTTGRIGQERIPLVWYLHQSRDAVDTARQLTQSLEPDYDLTRHGLVPYGALERRMLRWLGSDPAPEYVVEILEFRRKP